LHWFGFKSQKVGTEAQVKTFYGLRSRYFSAILVSTAFDINFRSLRKHTAIMANVDNLRNMLISKILTISDQGVLKALDKILTSSTRNQKVELTEEQLYMLKMSDEDIERGQVISQEELFRRERKWLNEG